MEKQIIKTQIGQIAVFSKQTEHQAMPVIFLHGVYFDHHLWENQVNAITDRPVLAIDMPLHGESKTSIKKNWTLDDCALMLLEILDSLKIEKVMAVGHSWGSMTILRAANQNPERFAGVVLCNMPFKEPAKKEIHNIKLQHTAMVFRKFYMKQAGKSLMSKESLSNNPGLLDKLIGPMRKLSNKEVKYTDKAVRMDAKDATSLIHKLTLPAFAIVGEEDYVGLPPIKETILVKGGHVSPIEVPDEVNNQITKLIQLIDKG
ncbi:MAG TPA: alpha/beta hydrolase [Bacteroidales bacterium]|nr:alpha/beta hydrolase [Bacteroidales bacterium]